MSLGKAVKRAIEKTQEMASSASTPTVSTGGPRTSMVGKPQQQPERTLRGADGTNMDSARVGRVRPSHSGYTEM